MFRIPHLHCIYPFGSQFLFTLPRLLSLMGIMASSSANSDPVAVWYDGNRQARPSRNSSPPALSMYRSVLILINYLPAIDDIQRYHRSRVIDNALQEPVYGNPWIIRPAIFIIGETIRPSSLLHTTLKAYMKHWCIRSKFVGKSTSLMISSPCGSPILMVALTTFPGMHTSFGRWSSIDVTGTSPTC